MGMPSCDCVPPDGDDWTIPWLRECDYHKAQREALKKAFDALTAERERCYEVVADEQLYPSNPDAAIVNPSIHRAMQRIEAGTTLDDLRRECRGEKA